jgi:hypothetical protein
LTLLFSCVRFNLYVTVLYADPLASRSNGMDSLQPHSFKLTSIKSILYFQNCPHGRPTLRHLFNLDLLPDTDWFNINNH